MNKLKKWAGIALSVVAAHAGAQSIDPARVERTIEVGETITIHKTISLPAAGATMVDVFFLLDDTGSMGGIIDKAKWGASRIMEALPNTYRFGVASYNADPSEAGASPALAFNRRSDLTTDKGSVQAGIDSIAANGGGDDPEAGYYALRQTASTSSWADASQRLIVWFGDAPSHVETVSQSQVISSMKGVGAEVVAFNGSYYGAGTGIDARDNAGSVKDPTGTHQASELIAAVGGSLTHKAKDLTSEQFVSKVTGEIRAASSFVDLVFGHTYAGSGLELSLACTDLLGCADVGGGETRTFDLRIKGLAPGSYAFDVFARGVDAVEHDVITVRGAAAIPEPGTLALMLAGLACAGLVACRRKSAVGSSTP